MNFVRLMRSLSNLRMFGIQKGVAWNVCSMSSQITMLSILIFCWSGVSGGALTITFLHSYSFLDGPFEGWDQLYSNVGIWFVL